MRKVRIFTIINLVVAGAWGAPVAAHQGSQVLQNFDFVDNGQPDDAKVALGRSLFFDKLLSGNINISCATCHHTLTDTGDGLALPIGEGGQGLGVTRNTGVGTNAVVERVPRNAPPLFALGARSVTALFHDGRLQPDPSFVSGFFNPAGNDLPAGLDNILAAQAMFPVTSATEMAGQVGENSIADAAAIGDLAGPHGIWAQLADRLRAVPEYVTAFERVYGISAAEITYAHAANAIAAFEIASWRANESPFDRYLKGDRRAMSPAAKRGLRLFYGRARCSTCHFGPLLSDFDFHAIAMPQIGPGKGDGTDGHEDFGRERVTGNPADRYRFRTPPLRNVALTAPYGHAGAYETLEAVVRHHLNPVASLHAYDCRQATLPSRPDLDAIDCLVHEDPIRRGAIAAQNELTPRWLSDRQVDDLIAFLNALTNPHNIDLRRDTPKSVLSGVTLVE